MINCLKDKNFLFIQVFVVFEWVFGRFLDYLMVYFYVFYLRGLWYYFCKNWIVIIFFVFDFVVWIFCYWVLGEELNVVVF